MAGIFDRDAERPTSVIWPAKLPSSSASFKYGFSRAESSAESDGMLSAFTTAPVIR